MKIIQETEEVFNNEEERLVSKNQISSINTMLVKVISYGCLIKQKEKSLEKLQNISGELLWSGATCGFHYYHYCEGLAIIILVFLLTISRQYSQQIRAWNLSSLDSSFFLLKTLLWHLTGSKEQMIHAGEIFKIWKFFWRLEVYCRAGVQSQERDESHRISKTMCDESG